jgi:hypothetical protein
MKKDKVFVFIFSLFAFCPESFGQTLTRNALFNYTITNVYQNNGHAITGQALQNTLLNYDYSCLNIRSDTNVVYMFDSNFTYYIGQKILIPSIIPIVPYAYAFSGDSAIYKYTPTSGLMRCDTAMYKGHFDTIHFKPTIGYWQNLAR